MELTPRLTVANGRRRKKNKCFSSLTVVQDGKDRQLTKEQKHTNTKKRTKKRPRPKNIKIFEDDAITCDDTFIVSAYSTFKSHNQGLSQSPNNINLSWGEEKEDIENIIETIDRSFRSIGFDVILIGFESLLLLLCRSDPITEMKISSRLLFCSEDDTFSKIKTAIYDGLAIHERYMLPSLDPEVWFSNEKKLFSLAIMAHAFRNIKQSMTEKEKPSLTKFIERDGPFLRCTLSEHLSLEHEQEQCDQISECLEFLISHSEK